MKIIKNIWQRELWPVNQMKDCSKGSALQQLAAYEFNQKNAHILVIPILNWIILFLINFCGILLTEYYQKILHYLIYLTAFFAILFTMCFIGCIILLISYLFLTNVNAKLISQ